MNICSDKISISVGGTGCGKQVRQLQHLRVMEVPHVDALAKVPIGTIGIVSGDIGRLGLGLALSQAAAKQGIDIKFIQDEPQKKTDSGFVINTINEFIDKPKSNSVIKSSKGKTNYGSNYTPPKKKRKKR